MNLVKFSGGVNYLALLDNDDIPDGEIVAAKLADVLGLVAGTYTNPTVTVNAKGLITAISNGTAGSPDVRVRAVVTYDFSGNAEVPSGYPVSSSRTDTVTVSPGDKVLLYSETDQAVNGFYIIPATNINWARSNDPIVPGMQVQVMPGGASAGRHIFMNMNTTVPVVGTDAITFNRPYALPPNDSVTSATIANQQLELRHLSGIGSPPTIAAGPAAGTGPTVSISGTDMRGVITVTTGTVPVLGDVLCTVTFAAAYAAAPGGILLFQANDNAAGRISQIYIDPADTTSALFKIRVGLSGALTASTTYKYHYTVIG